LPAEEKTDLVWAPASVAVMYPDGFATRIVREGPATAGPKVAAKIGQTRLIDPDLAWTKVDPAPKSGECAKPRRSRLRIALAQSAVRKREITPVNKQEVVGVRRATNTAVLITSAE